MADETTVPLDLDAIQARADAVLLCDRPDCDLRKCQGQRDNAAMLTALRAVLAEHPQVGQRLVGFPRAVLQETYCTGCQHPSPCPTMRAMTPQTPTERRERTESMSEPQRFRKKPVVIEAIQLGPLNIADVEEFVGGDAGNGPDGLVIATLEGAMRVSLGDYVIRGVQGEFYPCKPDIFEATYEAVSA